MNIKMLDDEYLPPNFKFPKQYIKLLELGLTNLEPWNILDAERACFRLEGLKKRYPDKNYIPFAERQDMDDIACFECAKGESVRIVHDYASAGYECRQLYDEFWDWFRDAIEEMIFFVSV